ncbi:hypothetical protein T484DRAFT_1816208, partial [Baffinella frigidus]
KHPFIGGLVTYCQERQVEWRSALEYLDDASSHSFSHGTGGGASRAGAGKPELTPEQETERNDIIAHLDTELAPDQEAQWCPPSTTPTELTPEQETERNDIIARLDAFLASDRTQEVFEAGVSPFGRRVVHEESDRRNLLHESSGEHELRFVTASKIVLPKALLPSAPTLKTVAEDAGKAVAAHAGKPVAEELKTVAEDKAVAKAASSAPAVGAIASGSARSGAEFPAGGSAAENGAANILDVHAGQALAGHGAAPVQDRQDPAPATGCEPGEPAAVLEDAVLQRLNAFAALGGEEAGGAEALGGNMGGRAANAGATTAATSGAGVGAGLSLTAQLHAERAARAAGAKTAPGGAVIK